MGTEIAKADAACLTPQEIEVAQTVLRTEHEAQLDPVTFSGVARFASGPAPQIQLPTQDEVRRLIGTLAGTLRAPKTSLDQGKLQLAMYWAALRDVQLFRLNIVAANLIKTASWMPTPGEIRNEAVKLGHPLLIAHAKARRFVRDRAQREFEHRLLQLRKRELSQAEIDELDDVMRESAVTQGYLTPRPEGGHVYRSREAIELWEEHCRSLPKLENGGNDDA